MHTNVFTPENATMLLIDHQVGTMSWTHSHDVEEVKKNALNLAKIATAVNMPLVLTSSMEDNIQGPLVQELKEIAPKAFVDRIKRVGIVNAMHDENYSNAVKATGRKKVVVAGITTEVCSCSRSCNSSTRGTMSRWWPMRPRRSPKSATTLRYAAWSKPAP